LKKNDTHSIDRYVITGIFLSLFLYNPAQSESVGEPIDFDYKNIPLKTALDSLIEIHRVAVVYQDRHLEGKQTSAQCIHCSTEDALNNLLLNQNLQWKKKGNQFIVVATLNPDIINEFVLSGIVRDEITGEPIPYANVHIQNTHLGDITNTEGYFYIASQLDSSFFNVSYIGYEPVQIPFSLTDSSDSLWIIELSPKVIRAEGVTVTGNDIEFFSQPLKTGQLSFSPRHIASLPKLGETDVFRSLKLLPGIQIGNVGSAGLYIRGGTPDQNLILLDGMSVYQTDHFYGFFSAINSEAIKDIQIFKGGIPAKYGGRTSSVIELTGKQGNTKKRRLSFYSNLLTAGLTYEEPLFGRGSLFMTYRGSYSHYYRTFLFDHIYNFLTDGEGQNSLSISTDSTDYSPRLSFYDFNGKITFMPNNHNVLSFSYFAGKDDIDRMYDFPYEQHLDKIQDASQWTNNSKSLKWSRNWGNTFYSHFFVSKSDYYNVSFHDEFFTSLSPIHISDKNQLSDVTIRLDSEWSLNSSHDLEFGLSRKQYKTKYEFQLLDLSPEKKSFNSFLNTYYFQDRWTLNSKLKMITGFRISDYSLTNKLISEPRISFTFVLTDYLILKGSLDKYTQFIHRFSNDFMIGGKKYVWLLSDERINPIISKQVNFGVQYNDKNTASEISIFHREVSHIADFSRLQFPSDAYVPQDLIPNSVENINFGSGSSRGLEFLIQKKTGFLRGWFSYTYGLTEYLFSDSSFNDGLNFKANHDRSHEIKSVAISSYKNWDVSLSWIFSSGSVYTPKGMQYFSNNVFPFTVIPDSSVEMNSERLPFIRRVDVSITKHFRYGSMNWEMGLSVFNLFGRKNVSHKKYITSENSEIVTTNVEMLGFTPTFHIRLSI
jgi:outer membrane receptor for ferrienterochelin and colicin